MVRSPLFGVRPHQLLGIKGQGPYSWYGPWVSSLHGLLPLGVSGLGLLLKHLQIIRYRMRELLKVPCVGMVDIPLHFAAVIPDIGRNAVAEIGIAHLLAAENVLKVEDEVVDITLRPIQDSQAQGVIMAGNATSDKLDLCAGHIVQAYIAGSAHEGGVRMFTSHDFSKLLLKIGHHFTSLHHLDFGRLLL